MKIIHTIAEVRNEIKKARKDNKSVGFVPTMGYLHEGHASLMRRAKMENDLVIISIFVNPTQFGPGEDLGSYPRDLDRDSALSESAGVDFLFAPQVKEIYPNGYTTYVEVEGEITKQLCGKSRPGHFKGVTSIVAKLFNIVMPDTAYFGQKDAQQVAVIMQMVRDLNFDIEIIPCPIVREEDGLALSSRNTFLNSQERQEATILSRSLFEVKQRIEAGERDASKIRESITSNISTVKSANIDYIDIVNAKILQKVDKIDGDVLIALAVKIGKTRLIDNIRLEV